MKGFARSILVGALAMTFAGSASAAPEAVIFTLSASETFDAGAASSVTFTPAIPFSGTGTVDEETGSYSLDLPDFTVTVDVLDDATPDADILTTGWNQTGTFAAGVGGALTSSSTAGNVVCTPIAGAPFGPLVCALTLPTVQAWPPTGDPGPTLGAPGATIDIATNTIVVIEPFDANAGQLRNTYTYALVSTPVPILPVWGMAMLGLMLLTVTTVAVRRHVTLPRA